MRTVWIYVDTRYLPGHPDYLKVFANPVAADEWCKENDSEGVAFGPEVKPGRNPDSQKRKLATS
jgi:hypothetical protein